MTQSEIPSFDPDIRLYGEMDDDMYENFYQQLKEAEKKDGPLILCLTTQGGDPDAARRMAIEIRLLHEKRGAIFIFSARHAFIRPGLF